LHRGPGLGIVEVPLADARSWAAHTQDEDWLIWRARRCAERLKAMPIDLEPGERIVGKPLLRKPTPAEAPQLQEAQKTLATMPPFPGGDPGHFHPDYEKLFRIGVKGILEEIADRRGKPSLTQEQQNFYDACRIAMEAFPAFAHRVGEACEAKSWDQLATICHRVATEPPTTFHEAIQLMFLMQIALWFGEDHHLTTPGRMDQTLRPFYESDLAAGRITRREAFELVCCLYIQMNRILWPGSAVSVMVGGRDRKGRDVTNELTYLCLAARLATRLVYPTVGVAWHSGTPGELMDFCMRLLASGLGDPAFFNDEVISQGLREHGVTEEDSYNHMNSTCVEIKVAGASNMWVTQPYFNLPKALLAVMKSPPPTFEALVAEVKKNLAETIHGAAERLDAVWKQRARTGCFPLASCVVKDCLERGLDYDRGGARYNWVENSFVGLANLVDGLLAIKHLVYDEKEISLAEFNEVLKKNFQGHEALRQRIINTLPKYGNDEETPDAMAKEWAEFLIATTESNTVGLHRYVPGFFCWVMHERMGAETGATPDGRLAGWPLADGAGAAQGRERKGPTASVLSTTKWCHRPALGGLVHNAKFSKSLLKTQKARKALRHVIETYMKRGGFEIQINIVGKEVLLDAQKHPEQYQDLLVRIAGYSDYFVHLNKNMQEEIIARTEHAI
jgi:formate C-acetyltransferase